MVLSKQASFLATMNFRPFTAAATQPYECEYLCNDHYLLFLMTITVPYISLRFTHLAHYSLESYLSRDEDFITNLNELPTVPVICTANTAGSDCTSIYTCT